jgi:hypothetical protein
MDDQATLLKLTDALARARSALTALNELDDLLRINPEAVSDTQLTFLVTTADDLVEELGDVRTHAHTLQAERATTPAALARDRATNRDAYKPVDKPLHFLVERRQLSNHPDDAEVILKMGAFANALSALMRRYPFGTAVSRVERRDRLHLNIIAAAYIEESRRTMNQRHNGLGWELVELGHANGRADPQEMTFSEIKTLLSKDSDFGRRLRTIRDKFAFHFDSDPFLNWLGEQTVYDALTLYVVENSNPRDIVFESSAMVMHSAFKELNEPGFVRRTALIASSFPHIVDAMLKGFKHKHGLHSVPSPMNVEVHEAS